MAWESPAAALAPKDAAVELRVVSRMCAGTDKGGKELAEALTAAASQVRDELTPLRGGWTNCWEELKLMRSISAESELLKDVGARPSCGVVGGLGSSRQAHERNMNVERIST